MTKNLRDITKYLLMFLLSSFIGWVYEIICVYVVFGRYFDRGVLHISCCPIYGFGMLILYFLFRKIKNPAVIFLGSVAITTSVEYLTAIVAEYKFHRILWSYEGWPLSFQDRISLVSSLIFGVMATVFIKLIKPPIDRLFKSKHGAASAVIVTILFIAAVSWEMMHR